MRNIDSRVLVMLCTFLILQVNSIAQDGSGPFEGVELSAEHVDAVNKIRRINLQYDVFPTRPDLDTEYNQWLIETFESIDSTKNKIDAVWWDIGGYSDMMKWPDSQYPSKLGLKKLPYNNPLLKKWWDQDIDWIEGLVKESKERELEVFWNHRISETFFLPENALKDDHPNWFVKSWYYKGLWNLASPEVREYKVAFLQELLERYELDGIQLDFARHVPSLPVGRQWELRENATEFVRMVRIMMLEMESKLGRPLLLSARVPKNLEGCHRDGFDVETWAQENLIDIFTLGSRSINVDFEDYRRITANRNIKLQACWDDHHSSDAYRSPPAEVHRGTFGNWWQQGADGIMIFNWFVDRKKEYNGSGLVDIVKEGITPESLHLKDKTFVVERSGGYPWAEGFMNRNEDCILPVVLANNGNTQELVINISDYINALGPKINKITLSAVVFGAKEGDEIKARLNGVELFSTVQDFSWKDNQILAPNPQQNSGGSMPPNRPVDPKQKLLRLEFSINPSLCRIGKNYAEIFIAKRAPYGHGNSLRDNISLEKLELSVDYK